MTEEIQETQLETKPESIANLRQQDWYVYLIEELEATKTEGEYNARWELIKTYHAIGKILTEQLENFSGAKVYGSQIYETVAEDINKSTVTVYKAVQFYKKYPNAIEDVSSVPEGKDISWSKIVKKYLHEPRTYNTDISAISGSTELSSHTEKSDKPNTVTSQKQINSVIFSLADILDLFLSSTSIVTDFNEIAIIYIKYILNKYTIYELKQLLKIYLPERNEEDYKRLTTLSECIDKYEKELLATYPNTSALFEDIQPDKSNINNGEKNPTTSSPVPVKEFLALYVELFISKFKRKPLTGPKVYASVGKLLKIKLSQGYQFPELEVLLRIYSKPENSTFCNFAIHPFFSDNVFNNLLAQKSKSSNQVPDGKYDQYEK